MERVAKGLKEVAQGYRVQCVVQACKRTSEAAPKAEHCMDRKTKPTKAIKTCLFSKS